MPGLLTDPNGRGIKQEQFSSPARGPESAIPNGSAQSSPVPGLPSTVRHSRYNYVPDAFDSDLHRRPTALDPRWHYPVDISPPGPEYFPSMSPINHMIQYSNAVNGTRSYTFFNPRYISYNNQSDVVNYAMPYEVEQQPDLPPVYGSSIGTPFGGHSGFNESAVRHTQASTKLCPRFTQGEEIHQPPSGMQTRVQSPALEVDDDPSPPAQKVVKRGSKKSKVKVEKKDEDSEQDENVTPVTPLAVSDSDVVLYFKTREEAVAGMHKPSWSPPSDDVSIPDTDEARQGWVRKLVAAMTDLSQFKDKAGAVFRRRWYDPAYGKKDFYDPKAVEKVCWDILDFAERLHRDGPSVFKCYDPEFLKVLAKSETLTFGDRMELLINLVQHFKGRCDKLLKGGTLETYVGAPDGMLETANQNRANNDKRQVWIEIGRPPKSRSSVRRTRTRHRSVDSSEDPTEEDGMQEESGAHDEDGMSGEDHVHLDQDGQDQCEVHEHHDLPNDAVLLCEGDDNNNNQASDFEDAMHVLAAVTDGDNEDDMPGTEETIASSVIPTTPGSREKRKANKAEFDSDEESEPDVKRVKK